MVTMMILIMIATGGVAVYYFQNYKKQEYLLDYQIERLKEEQDHQNKRQELDRHIREEQKNKKFYMDVILTHEGAIGARSCFDNFGKRRSGILSIGDIVMIGRNRMGEDYRYRIDEAGLEIWATTDQDTLMLKSQKEPFEIRKKGMARDEGNRTQKVMIREGEQYYIVLNRKHEIGLSARRGI